MSCRRRINDRGLPTLAGPDFLLRFLDMVFFSAAALRPSSLLLSQVSSRSTLRVRRPPLSSQMEPSRFAPPETPSRS
ncbi:hypothetical protein PAXINDRAFT_22066 [Paxillus involutus ATCC 200175]|uniref:Uncharacterized protein n=1 Tax=Paxillus involutus ATCC 200175 TaxID=664439 RepID=A0A0C9SSK1_PAXIN|nr:hypothetical protein PAXINDRAFT_22066 [Paxillus involutus ATCC 200175]